jgi:methenyltetrahydrofolate cyclohydrolase
VPFGPLTVNRKGYEASWSEAEQILAESAQRIRSLRQLADDDVAAFSDLMAAWKGRAANEEGFLQAVLAATEVPLRIARECLSVLKLAQRIAAFGATAMHAQTLAWRHVSASGHSRRPC